MDCEQKPCLVPLAGDGKAWDYFFSSLPLSATYSNPKKRICSHTQESSSKMIMAGKAKPNQEAKFTTLPFRGKILKGNKGCCVALPSDKPVPFVPQSECRPSPHQSLTS